MRLVAFGKLPNAAGCSLRSPETITETYRVLRMTLGS
jgi:hypothetical protein